MNKKPSRLKVINRITILFTAFTIIDSITIIDFDLKDTYVMAWGSILTLGYGAYFSAKAYENKK